MVWRPGHDQELFGGKGYDDFLAVFEGRKAPDAMVNGTLLRCLLAIYPLHCGLSLPAVARSVSAHFSSSPTPVAVCLARLELLCETLHPDHLRDLLCNIWIYIAP